MPLDATGTPDALAEAPAAIPEFKMGREGLANLAYVLRNPELWERSIEWDYGSIFEQKEVEHKCGIVGCALGVAMICWPGNEAVIDPIYNFKCFGVPDEAGMQEIFFSCFSYGFRPFDSAKVTPTMVADKIDHYLATGQV